MSYLQKMYNKENHNYVYLYKTNYTKISSENPTQAFTNIKNAILKQVENKKEQGFLDIIAEQYSNGVNFLRGFGKNVNDNSIYQKIQKHLFEKYSLDSEEFEIDFDRLVVQKKNGGLDDERLVQNVNRIKKRFDKNKNVYKVKVQTIRDRFDQAFKLLEEARKAFNQIPDRKEKIENAIRQMEDLFVAIMGFFNEASKDNFNADAEVKKLVAAGVSQAKALKSIDKNRISYEAAQAIRRSINEILACAETAPVQNILGDLFEIFGNAALALPDSIAEKEIADWAINAAKATGGNLVETNLNLGVSKNVAQQLQKNISNLQVDLGETKVSASVVYSSQQKADLIVNIYGGTGVNMKNYKDVDFKGKAKNITLQSGSPMLSHLLGANSLYPTASRHFLNIFTENPEDNNKGSTFNEAKKLGQKTFELLCLWQAFTGKGLGRAGGFAQIFMWNDNKTGRVRFFNINTIISYIAKKENLSFIHPSVEKIELKNEKVSNNKGDLGAAIQTRLANVLAEAHTQKITTMIPMDVLKDINYIVHF